jgi:hypothetical protein
MGNIKNANKCACIRGATTSRNKFHARRGANAGIPIGHRHRYMSDHAATGNASQSLVRPVDF